jgi:hypothetical protein
MENKMTFRERENLIISILVAILVVLFVVILNLSFELGIVTNLVMCWILTTFYGIFAFLLVGTTDFAVINNEREVVKQVIVEKPVYVERRIPIQIPVENKVVEVVEVEKPIIEIKEVPVYHKIKTQGKKKLIIPKYAYIGSHETLRYHKRSCRLSKLIKRKHKLSSNSKEFFKKKHFKACKVCLRKSKK